MMTLATFAIVLATLNVGSMAPPLKVQTVCMRPDGSTPRPTEAIALPPNRISVCVTSINQPAPPGGFEVSPFAVDQPLITVPAQLTIPAGAVLVVFTVRRGAQ